MVDDNPVKRIKSMKIAGKRQRRRQKRKGYDRILKDMKEFCTTRNDAEDRGFCRGGNQGPRPCIIKTGVGEEEGLEHTQLQLIRKTIIQVQNMQ